MNILYLTPLWSGLKDFFIKGEEKVAGMPAFYEVFIRLLENKQIEKILIILITNQTKFKINSKYEDKIIIYPINIANKYQMLYKSFYIAIKIILLSKKYNVKCLYGHGGTYSFITSISSLFIKAKNFRRIYGTFIINDIDKSKLKIFLKYPWEYLSFKLKVDDIFITNDGTHGDLVYSKIGYKKIKPNFLINGVNKAPKFDNIDIDINSKYITYIARIDRWKRQNLLIDVINQAKLKGYSIPTYIVGNVFDIEFYNELKIQIEKFNLNEIVKIIPGLSVDKKNTILKNSYCTFSLYDTSNLGNVFFESLSLGVPIIAYNINNSLDYIDKKAFICIDNDNIDSILNELIYVWNDSEFHNKISNNAKKYSDDYLLTWDERAKIEINSILNY